MPVVKAWMVLKLRNIPQIDDLVVIHHNLPMIYYGRVVTQNHLRQKQQKKTIQKILPNRIHHS